MELASTTLHELEEAMLWILCYAVGKGNVCEYYGV